MDSAWLKLKAQLYRGDEIAIGPGKADLLDTIAATGSISAAARKMHMSYRRAWLLVDTMNRNWRSPLVSTTVGGRTGASLTDLGIEILAAYRALETELSSLNESKSTDYLLGQLATGEKTRSPE